MEKAKKRIWITFALCILTICVVLVIASFFIPLYGDICSKNEYTNAKECTPHHIALVAFWQIVKATNDWSAAIIALFTVILGVATWALWRATRDLVEGAEETSEKQLRAYVNVGPNTLTINDPNRSISLKITFRNNGHTPAHDVIVWMDASVWGLPLDEAFPLHGRHKELPSRGIIGPTADLEIETRLTLTPDEFVEVGLNEPMKAVIVWGEVQYRDVFDQPRWLRYKYRIRQAGDRKWAASPTWDNNKGN